MSLQLEKLHAMGYKPLLLPQKEGNGKKPKITSLTPRCELDPLATQHLSKITAFYELVCAGEMYSIFFFSRHTVYSWLSILPYFFSTYQIFIVYTTNDNLITFQRCGMLVTWTRQSWQTRHCPLKVELLFVAEKLSRKINK